MSLQHKNIPEYYTFKTNMVYIHIYYYKNFKQTGQEKTYQNISFQPILY